MRVRLLVVDDHTLFRRGLIALLSQSPEVEVAGEAADAGEALRHTALLRPDVILLDNHLPGVHGVDALPQLLAACPSTRVLMLTVSEDADDLANALARGASGYLLKTVEGDDLVQSVLRVHKGESVVSPEMTSKLVRAYRQAVQPADAGAAVSPPPPEPAATPAAPTEPVAEASASAATGATNRLSPRERDILREIARGASNKEIARSLDIAETTVKIHVQHILRKLNLSSRVQVAVYAVNHGLDQST
ncbi:response regulator [Aquabacterium fontiphilum]|uniref:response regulator n=1 Tax=Aquabacterium fontiphilum TaxID=450365 RepID=UPI00137692C7|nr:response regulator [Aquabacterium fontiphilum]NBD21365.1 response regulator [Aquabacterium fontiphilum]